ncbi:MAG TPA: outer membrane protein transport protein [Polyangiaceae bacterium]|nr:outer membrane protein transport protein [Polyangiaceae bacterium]
MKQFARSSLLAAALCLASEPCFANGFLIYDLSGEAIGRASAVSADTSDATAVWFNPAALATMQGASVSAGGVFITARSDFEARGGGGETSSKRGNFVLPALFGAGKIGDRVALGVGVYSAFGIGVGWPESWLGRENAISATLQTLSLNPTVAVELGDGWSLAAGFDAVRSTVDFENGLPSIVGGDVRLVGGAWGFGFNAAALYRALPDRLHFALTYRSRVKLDYDGRADFSPGNPDFDRTLPDQPGHAAITLPDVVTAGVMIRPGRDFKLGFDANLELWSTYDRIDIDFATAPDRTLHPRGHDSFTLRGGLDFEPHRHGFHVRGGLIFDRSAIPASGVGPALPDADRVDATAGFGYAEGGFKADLGYMLVVFLPADARGGTESPEGRYHTLAHLVGLTLGAHF